MSRIQTLELDIRRSTARLSGRRRPTPPAQRPSYPEAAPKAPRSTDQPAATPPAYAPAKPGQAAPLAGEPAKTTEASVAAAMSSWRGSRAPGRTLAASTPRASRSRAFAMTLDYRVPDLPMPIRQTSDMTCWAFVATMMASWRDRTSHTVQAYIGSLGEPWISKLTANSGLRVAEVAQLLATLGMQIETTQANFTAERWESMLRDWGPLWVNADNNRASEVQGLHAHIVVGIHGPSDGNPTVDLIDPAIGREVQMSMSDFVARYEQLATGTFAGLQICHWPARAQQAAQQSLVWAQQAAARRAQMQSAEAAVAAVGLLYQVYKDVITTNGLSWKHAELRGKTVPGNSEAKKALADQGTYQAKRLKSLRRLTWDEFAWDDNVGAEFEISYEYNGTCVANVRLTNTSYAPPRPLSGRNLSVDTNITQAFSNERDDVSAVEVEIVYQFTYARGSAGTFTQRYVLFGDGRQELFTETRS
jgi:hypothetical protein